MMASDFKDVTMILQITVVKWAMCTIYSSEYKLDDPSLRYEKLEVFHLLLVL